MRTETWEVSDELWTLVEPLVPSQEELRSDDKTYKRKVGAGRKPRYTNRTYFSAIIYVLRNGLIWNAIPREKFGGLGSSALHSKFLLWANAGFFDRIWEAGLYKYDELQGISWKWQVADGCQIKAPLTQESVGSNPTDREKNGRKWAVLVEENGVPLSLVVDGTNRHNSKLLEPLLEQRFCPIKKLRNKPNLCLDAGFVGKEQVVIKNGFTPHIRPRGEEKKELKNNPKFKAKRWVVETCNS